MNQTRQKYGNWALVAGAAEGIGEGFTTVLAEMGFNIILVDQNLAAMNTLAINIMQNHNIETRILRLDLIDGDSAAKCLDAAKSVGARLLVYVAAYSRVKRFSELKSDDLDGFLNINCRTLLHLVHGFSNHLIQENKNGGIILLSSLAGLIGPQYVATYAATKAFIIRLAEALRDELKGKRIDILACAAGTVSTPTYRKSKPSFEKMKPPVMQPDEVAGYAISRLGKASLCIPGLSNRLTYFFLLKILPRSLASRLVNQAMKKMYDI